MRTDIENHVVFGNIRYQLDRGLCILSEGLGHHHVNRQRHTDPGRNGFGGIQQIRLIQRLAHRQAGRCQEGIGDAAADDQLVADLCQRVQHIQFGRHLGAGNNRCHRFGRITQCLAQRLQLGSQQRAGAGDLGKFGHAVGRSFGAVCSAKGIHDEHVAQRRILLRQFVGVLLFTLVEAHVLEQHQLAGLDLDTAEVVGNQRHFTAQGFTQIGGHRRQAVFSTEFTLDRTPQVRADHHGSAFLQSQSDGWQGSEDACITLHHTVFHRHVEVFTDQYALAGKVKVGHFQNGHGSSPSRG